MIARTEGERSEVRDWTSSGSILKVGDFLQQHLGVRAQEEKGSWLAWSRARAGQVCQWLEDGQKG